MSRQPDRYTCAETLVHETQHLKLCALLDLVTLTRPDDGQRYYAPWRPDPRPASGLLQGAYAFLGVSGFWREQRRAAPEREGQPAGPGRVRPLARRRRARGRDPAAQRAAHPGGQVFVGEMAEVLDAWRREPVPATARVVAQHMADRHLAQWHADNGPARPGRAARSDSGRVEVRVESLVSRRHHGVGEIRPRRCRRRSRSTSALSASPDFLVAGRGRSRARFAAQPRVCGWVGPSSAVSRGSVSSPMRRASSDASSAARSLARFMATVSVKW